MAKSRTSELDLKSDVSRFGSMDVFGNLGAPSSSVPREEDQEPAVEEQQETVVKEVNIEGMYARDTEPELFKTPTPAEIETEHSSSGMEPIIREKNVAVKQTSVILRRSSANYSAYRARLLGITQNRYFEDLIVKDINANRSTQVVPNFNAIVERVPQSEAVTKAITIPQSVFNDGRNQAYLRMQSFGNYLNGLIQKDMEEQGIMQ